MYEASECMRWYETRVWNNGDMTGTWKGKTLIYMYTGYVCMETEIGSASKGEAGGLRARPWHCLVENEASIFV